MQQAIFNRAHKFHLAIILQFYMQCMKCDGRPNYGLGGKRFERWRLLRRGFFRHCGGKSNEALGPTLFSLEPGCVPIRAKNSTRPMQCNWMDAYTEAIRQSLHSSIVIKAASGLCVLTASPSYSSYSQTSFNRTKTHQENGGGGNFHSVTPRGITSSLRVTNPLHKFQLSKETAGRKDTSAINDPFMCA